MKQYQKRSLKQLLKLTLLTILLSTVMSENSAESPPTVTKKINGKIVKSSSASILTSELLNRDKHFLSEKELFTIEVLDHNKPEDR